MQSITATVTSSEPARLEWVRVLALLPIAFAAAVILMHALLITAGGWGGDEYFNFFLYREHGLQWLLVRLLDWSPRPSSDAVLYFYALVVNHWRMPLIGPFLALLWATMFISTLLAAWQRGSAGLLPRLAAACAVLAMFMLGHRVNDLFYWPMGATPYLLDLTGIAVVAFQVLAGGTERRSARIGCATALAVAATSSETGLFFALTFTAVLFLLEAPASLPVWRTTFKSQAWYLVPLLISVITAALLLSIIAHNAARGIDQGSPYFHHFGASLAATLLGLVPDMVRGDEGSSSMGALAWLLAYCLLVAGFRWACREGMAAPVRRRELVALSAGLIGCYVLTLFTTYYEYGQRVHEPQTAFRRCLVVLGLLIAARVTVILWPRRWRLPDAVGPLALCAALWIGMQTRAPALFADLHLAAQVRQARNLTWDSGADRHTTTLRFVVHPQGQVINELIPQRDGTMVLGAPGTEWWMTGIMQFFAKSRLEIVPLPAGGAR